MNDLYDEGQGPNNKGWFMPDTNGNNSGDTKN